jgi:nucleotide-binding universal stress UspA family protein
MKVLIGYDGSDGARAAIADLKYAGLPPAGEAEVLSVADVFPQLSPESFAPSSPDAQASPMIKRARALAAAALADARVSADAGAAAARAVLPAGWTVRAAAGGDSPAWGLVKRADEWSPDLLAVGAHAGTPAARVLLLGSVTQKVVSHARCSVRVGRPRVRGGGGGPLRVMVGYDGSPGARAAIEMVAARPWPPGTEVAIVTVADAQARMAVLAALAGASDVGADEGAELERDLAAVAESLRKAGLANVTPLVREGEARSVLLAEAAAREVDCVFVGARGLSRVERFVLGSVSGGVAARAQCSVEVVRPRDVK